LLINGRQQLCRHRTGRTVSTVQEAGRHQQLQGDGHRYRELWYLRRVVGVMRLVHEVRADSLQNVRRYFTEMDDVGLVLRELSRTAQHGADRVRHQRELLLDDELVVVARHEFHVLGVRALAVAQRSELVVGHVRVETGNETLHKKNKTNK